MGQLRNGAQARTIQKAPGLALAPDNETTKGDKDATTPENVLEHPEHSIMRYPGKYFKAVEERPTISQASYV